MKSEILAAIEKAAEEYADGETPRRGGFIAGAKFGVELGVREAIKVLPRLWDTIEPEWSRVRSVLLSLLGEKGAGG